MRHKVILHLIVEEDDPDMAEVEVESQLADMMAISSTSIRDFEVKDVIEIEEEEL